MKLFWTFHELVVCLQWRHFPTTIKLIFEAATLLVLQLDKTTQFNVGISSCQAKPRKLHVGIRPHASSARRDQLPAVSPLPLFSDHGQRGTRTQETVKPEVITRHPPLFPKQSAKLLLFCVIFLQPPRAIRELLSAPKVSLKGHRKTNNATNKNTISATKIIINYQIMN